MKHIVVYLMGAEDVLYDSREYHLIAKDGERYIFAVLR
jgi:hypothetical protein